MPSFQAAGYGTYDPLDPTGMSGKLILLQKDTGFFQITEQEIIGLDKKDKKIRRKHIAIPALRSSSLFLFCLS